MKGMVRLLIFWVGRDDVGGGRISFLEPSEKGEPSWTDGVEVLFGSEPDRIPGGHNRWGCARELADWRSAGESGAPVLTGVFFEGFMSKSDEGSLTQVRQSAGSGREERLYEGNISQVENLEARGRLWRFHSFQHDTYRSPERVGGVYAVQVRSEPPDIDRSFDNRNHIYRIPYGFLTAVRSFIFEALAAKDSNSPLKGLRERKKVYLHNAKLYALAVKKVRLHKNFKLSRGEKFEHVLELDMETTNRESRSNHSFSLYVATQSTLRGIPLRIVDKPRWWLKIQLELDRQPR
jgi:hypothetical protein